MTPAPDAVRAQLDRILAADTFANAGRLSRLLRYLVDRTLAGEADSLKEYTLGLDVFDRPDSYDPRHDSIVRVEARRLRARLEDYYRGPGAADPLVIEIPRGSYVPIVRTAAAAASARQPLPLSETASEPATPAAGRSTRQIAIAGAAAAVVLVATLAAIWIRPDSSTTAEAANTPAIAVLPFQHFSTAEADALAAARLTDAVTTELARLGTLAVASRTSAAQYAGRPIPDIAQALDVDIVMEATIRLEGEDVRVESRLVDVAVDRKVWVGSFEGRPDAPDELARRIAAETSSTILQRLRRP